MTIPNNDEALFAVMTHEPTEIDILALRAGLTESEAALSAFNLNYANRVRRGPRWTYWIPPQPDLQEELPL